MRNVLLLALAVAASHARGQGPGREYYYWPEPPEDPCSGNPGSPCSIIECGPGWTQCGCPRELPKEQCEAARRKLPLYPAEEVRRHFRDEQKKTEASASGTPKGTDQPLDEKDIVSPRSEAARKLPDDQLCEPKMSGGGAHPRRPTTCTYKCGVVLVCIEVDPPDVCPGSQRGPSKTPWKNIKNLRPCKSKP